MKRGFRSTSEFPTTTSHYKPYQCRGKPVILNRNAFNVRSPPLFEDDDIAIEREEEHPLGDVTRRDLAHERLPRPTVPPPPCTLHDCFRKGVVDMASASRILSNMKSNHEFSEGSYKEFVRHVATRDVDQFSYEGFKLLRCEDFKLYAEAAQLMGDVLLAKWTFSERRSASSASDSVDLTSRSVFRVGNCSKTWTLEANEPFVEVDLIALSLPWTHRRKDSTYSQSLSLFRFLLKRIAKPPEVIKEYAIRVGRSGKDVGLKNLPEDVERTLIGFCEDMLGYGRDELRIGADFDRANSSFFMSLGTTNSEREEVLKKLITERSFWRKLLLKSLQRSLNDLRARWRDCATDANPQSPESGIDPRSAIAFPIRCDPLDKVNAPIYSKNLAK